MEQSSREYLYEELKGFGWSTIVLNQNWEIVMQTIFAMSLGRGGGQHHLFLYSGNNECPAMMLGKKRIGCAHGL